MIEGGTQNGIKTLTNEPNCIINEWPKEAKGEGGVKEEGGKEREIGEEGWMGKGSRKEYLDQTP